MDDVLIEPARPEHLSRLPEIERSAGEPFRTIDMGAVADDELPTVDRLTPYLEAGRCWVALGRIGPVGYLVADVVDDQGHVEQVSVDPRFARRGIGRRLMGQAERWAAGENRSTLTLTTFVEVPWNGPYYRRMGFRPLPDGELGPELAAIRLAEIEAGLDRWPRTAMAKPIGPGRDEP